MYLQISLSLLLLGLFMVGTDAFCADSAGFVYKDELTRRVVAEVPDILKKQDQATGRFGTGVFIARDQEPIYTLAVLWATKSDSNPYYHDAKVLEAIMAGGDALIEIADEDGRWEFRKKDNSFWGIIHMPWTYSRWIRTYSLIKDAMPDERRKRWEDALSLGYGNIAKQLGRVSNIATHHAMGLYLAGKEFNHPEWCEQAKEFMAKVVSEQDPGGFWSEHYGPVVAYNFVYVEALGIYYAMSGDKDVLPALERSSKFQAAFLYPDGSMVETVDERNPYKSNVVTGNVGLSFNPKGRGFLAQQFELLKKNDIQIPVDALASFILYGQEGAMVPTAAGERDRTFISSDKKSLIRRKDSWFICMSAYHCPVPESRWHQDRQNFVSIFHDRCGLIIGGGNTKLQPLWSNFTVGDTSLLKHKPGDTAPKFTPDGLLIHIPGGAAITNTDQPTLGFTYGRERCSIEALPVDDDTLRLIVRSTFKTGQAVEAHLTLIPHLDKPLKTAKGAEYQLNDNPASVLSDDVGKYISHAGWRLSIPEKAKVIWPVLPHNPYVKDGAAKLEEGRIVISLPFNADTQEYELALSVDK